MRRRKEGRRKEGRKEGRIVNTNKLTRRVLFPYLIGLCDGQGKDLGRGGGIVHECFFFFRFRAFFNVNSDNLRMVTPIYKWCWVLLWVQV